MGCVCVCVFVYTCKYTQKHSQAVHTGPVQPPLGTISKQVNYSHWSASVRARVWVSTRETHTETKRGWDQKRRKRHETRTGGSTKTREKQKTPLRKMSEVRTPFSSLESHSRLAQCSACIRVLPAPPLPGDGKPRSTYKVMCKHTHAIDLLLQASVLYPPKPLDMKQPHKKRRTNSQLTKGAKEGDLSKTTP